MCLIPTVREEVKYDLKRRYALVGLLAALSVLFSLILVFADDYPPGVSYGTIMHGAKRPFTNWKYVLPPVDPEYDTDDIVEMLFWFVVDEEKISVPITETSRDDYTVEFEFPPEYMQYGAIADHTWLEVQMDDGEWYYAVGPAPMWRRRP